MNTNTEDGSTFNWGGALGYSINTHVHFINLRVGLKLENKRGTVNWFYLGYRFKAGCSYYGSFEKD